MLSIVEFFIMSYLKSKISIRLKSKFLLNNILNQSF